MQFLCDTGRIIVRPELLGLPSTTGRGEAIVERSARLIEVALQEGDEEAVRQTVFDLYILAKHTLSDICDKVIAAAFREIGTAWGMQRSRSLPGTPGLNICLRVLHELRAVLLALTSSAGNRLDPSGDYYQLPTAMVQLVLNGRGWRATS